MPVHGGFRVLFTESRIASRVSEVAAEIDASLGEFARPPVLIGMLKGAAVFLADLVRAMSSEVEVDFMAISSPAGAPGGAGGARGGGRVRIEKDLDIDITGRTVMLVEDLVDTGFTLSYLLNSLRARDPETVSVVTMLDKRARRIIDVPLAHAGFEVADEFLLGYGIDYAGRYRNLPYIAAVDDLDALTADPDVFLKQALELVRGGEEAQAAQESV